MSGEEMRWYSTTRAKNSSFALNRNLSWNSPTWSFSQPLRVILWTGLVLFSHTPTDFHLWCMTLHLAAHPSFTCQNLQRIQWVATNVHANVLPPSIINADFWTLPIILTHTGSLEVFICFKHEMAYRRTVWRRVRYKFESVNVHPAESSCRSRIYSSGIGKKVGPM